MLVERGEGIKTITLNSPATSNSLTASAVEKLLQYVRESYSDGTQTLVLTARGPHFCAGFDLSGLDEARDGDLLLRFVRIELLLQAVYMAEFDTIACAKGATYGAGADLFGVCRCRLADPGARFLMPGLQFGVALGTRRFAALVGETTAYELLASGIPFDAASAHKIGFVSQIEPEHRWSEFVNQRHQARALKETSLSRLSGLTRGDTRAHDMLALVESASEPGLAARIRNYRETVQAQRKARRSPI